MELTLEQKAAVGRWVEEGARLADVQRRIHDEFGIQLTYMEVRFLVLDIGATPKERREEPAQQDEAEPAPQDEEEPAPQDREEPEAAEDFGDAQDNGLIGGKVSVELDKVVRAGAAMSGTVTFSDGVTGNWILDAYGRLGITKVSKPGYQPSQADVSAFQLELQRKISGY